jgi:ferredoxin
MPLITFSSPDFKDKTVYAVFGYAPDTLLAIARANRIPLRFHCGEGECGNCAIWVKHSDEQTFFGYPLDEKERQTLRTAGKLDGLPPLKRRVPGEWHLACRFIPREEDIVVEYEVNDVECSQKR